MDLYPEHVRIRIADSCAVKTSAQVSDLGARMGGSRSLYDVILHSQDVPCFAADYLPFR